MALQVNLSANKYGLDLPQAYVRFRKTPDHVDYGAGTVRLVIEVFANAAAASSGKAPLPGIKLKTPIVERTYNPATDAPFSIAGAAYAAVKADADKWPEFVGAADV